MQNIFKLITGVIFVAPLLSVQVQASEQVDIPFHLARGQLLYEKYCGSCHGIALDGSNQGPPLLHPFYKPSHHGDESVYRAMLQGVKQHHWEFGDMPPVQGMTPKKAERVISYLRFYQKQKKLY